MHDKYGIRIFSTSENQHMTITCDDEDILKKIQKVFNELKKYGHKIDINRNY